jgi:predicted kinase
MPTEIITDNLLKPSKPVVVVLTGVQAAGKSTIAALLARQFERGVHIEADVLQRMIVSGAQWVKEPQEPSGEPARQLRLRLKNMCMLAKSFYDAGFSVVLDDLIIGERWQQLQEDLADVPFSLVVLVPNREIVQQRDSTRSKPTLGAEWAVYLDTALRNTMTGLGLWVDNSGQTSLETATYILQKLSLTDK